MAINATAAGSLDVDVALSDLRKAAPSGPAASLEMRVLDLSGKPVGDPVTAKDVAFNEGTRLGLLPAKSGVKVAAPTGAKASVSSGR